MVVGSVSLDDDNGRRCRGLDRERRVMRRHDERLLRRHHIKKHRPVMARRAAKPVGVRVNRDSPIYLQSGFSAMRFWASSSVWNRPIILYLW
jgi:hypothetical protein